jgi:hypothetical protein
MSGGHEQCTISPSGASTAAGLLLTAKTQLHHLAEQVPLPLSLFLQVLPMFLPV